MDPQPQVRADTVRLGNVSLEHCPFAEVLAAHAPSEFRGAKLMSYFWSSATSPNRTTNSMQDGVHS